MGEDATRPIARLARCLAALRIKAGSDHAASSRLARQRASRALGLVQLRFLGSKAITEGKQERSQDLHEALFHQSRIHCIDRRGGQILSTPGVDRELMRPMRCLPRAEIIACYDRTAARLPGGNRGRPDVPGDCRPTRCESEHSDRASVTSKLAVHREENEWLAHRLGNQHAIEGVAMVVEGWQDGEREDVGVLDRQPREAH